jgi:hypothetical protein
MLLVGCTYYAPVQIVASNRPVTDVSNVKPRVAGQNCQHYLFGIPLGEGNTARLALDDAKRKAGTDVLTDITMDVKSFSIIIYGRACTIVQGAPVAG